MPSVSKSFGQTPDVGDAPAIFIWRKVLPRYIIRTVVKYTRIVSYNKHVCVCACVCVCV